MGVWTSLYRLGQRMQRARSAFARAWTAKLADMRRAPPPPGVSGGTVASLPMAEMDLKRLASSPSVYAAVMRRALGLLVYPVQVSRGYGAGRPKEVLDPDRTPFVGTLLRLLALPDPEDIGRVFPAHPGELVLAQVLADLLLTGNAYLRLQRSPRGGIVGLHRLHPQAVRLVRSAAGEERWEYRAAGAVPESYERGDVAHLHLLSWERAGAGELGTGAAEPLHDILDAEQAALASTATIVSQGGADVRITGKSPAMANYLRIPEHRAEIVEQATEAISGGAKGRRVFVVGGDLDIADAGLKPADIQAPETLIAARKAALMAIGVVPVAIGDDASNYASAVEQKRQQYELDSSLALIVEVCVLRPLARALALAEGGRWAQRASQLSAWLDLSTHPGAQLLRTDAQARAKGWQEMGWSNVQAVEAEGLEMPEPEGEVMLGAAPSPYGGTPSGPGAPRRPIGDGSPEDKPEPGAPAEDGPAARFWRALQSDAVAPSPAEYDAPEMERQALWTRAEQSRERSDRDLQSATERVLAQEERRYLDAIVPRLEAAARAVQGLLHRAAEDGEDGGAPKATDYGDLDVDGIVPDADADLYLSGLGPSWLLTWEEGAAAALSDLDDVDAEVPVPTSAPTTLDALAETAPDMARTTRDRVTAAVRRGVEAGRSPQEIARDLSDSGAFSQGRALTIARTETVRAQSEGTTVRFQAAQALGFELLQEWISARDGATRPEHRALDGQQVAVGERWTFADGVDTVAPGRSGVAAHDANCRCAVRPILA